MHTSIRKLSRSRAGVFALAMLALAVVMVPISPAAMAQPAAMSAMADHSDCHMADHGCAMDFQCDHGCAGCGHSISACVTGVLYVSAAPPDTIFGAPASTYQYLPFGLLARPPQNLLS